MEDHSAPVFAYHTWFHVGSRNEKQGTTGIAHLFEHLMFKETENTKEGEFDRILKNKAEKSMQPLMLIGHFIVRVCPSEGFHFDSRHLKPTACNICDFEPRTTRC
jgi:hypothetical protein